MHPLLNESSEAFLAAITQTVRLIRPKGIGVSFVMQTPNDIPAAVLAQLGARVQYGLSLRRTRRDGDGVDVPALRLRP